ncbi:hypothetical protein ACVIKO_005921 [Rhizobium ruizarguesonis]
MGNRPSGGSWTLLEVLGLVISPLLIGCVTFLIAIEMIQPHRLALEGSYGKDFAFKVDLQGTEKAPKRGQFPTQTIEESLSSPSRPDVKSIQDNAPDALQLPKAPRRLSSRSSSNAHDE